MSELIVVPEKETALQVLQKPDGLDPYLAAIREQVDAFNANPPRLTSAAGRKQYAAMAHKIARSKTAIDNVGKELVAELKEVPRKIDASRKVWRDTLDEWKAEVRAPLDEWEREEARRQAEIDERVAAIKTAALDLDELNLDGLRARLVATQAMDPELCGDFAIEAFPAKQVAIEAIEKAIADEEARIAEAEAIALKEAEEAKKRQAEREKALEEQAAQRERERLEAAHKAEQEAAERKRREEAEAVERKHREELEKLERAAKAEQERIAREAEEARKREANKNHRAKINRAALQALVDNAGLDEAAARKVVQAIAKGQVPRVKMEY